jgi:putative transposase
MQLIAGRVGQEYNQRKGRRGAFWEDRYHATAVGSEAFVTSVQARLGIRGRFKEITSESGMSVLREGPESYGTVFEGETGNLRALTPLWDSTSLYA